MLCDAMRCELYVWFCNMIRVLGFFVLKQVFRSLVSCTKEIKGAEVENNKFCVSVHYRNVDEKVGRLWAPEVE